jgi:hypothetical protein
MPRFDGTGPRGVGPMTGRGEGYCAVVLPSPGSGTEPYGYAGLGGRPVQLSSRGSPEGTAYPSRMPSIPTSPLWSFFGTRLGWRSGWRRGWHGGRRR